METERKDFRMSGLEERERAVELYFTTPMMTAQVVEHLAVLLQCLFDRFGSVFPQCGLMVFPGVVIVSR